MKTVVGVDLGGVYGPALSLSIDLDFPGQEFVFVNAVEPMPLYTAPMPDLLPNNTSWLDQLRLAGESAVAKAEILACKHHIQSWSEVRVSGAADLLIATADAENADLIAVGSERRAGVAGFLLGSVAHALTVGASQSILVTKGEQAIKYPTRAVFATDHSDYANRAFDRLLRWGPAGLTTIDVLTAFEVQEGYFLTIPDHLIDSRKALQSDLEEALRERGKHCSDGLKAAGYASDVYIKRGHPNAVIAEHMAETKADLLIVGAQGHGFIERLLVGSTALHQVSKEPYPVLVIRP